jgi:uncharacterized delta-60 repeat protein
MRSANSVSTIGIVACLLLSAAMPARSAGSGELDPGLGRNGRVNLWLDAALDVHPGGERNRGFVRQPSDGKLLLAGQRTVPPGTGIAAAIVRLNPDGSVDRSFGVSGLVTLDLYPGFETASDLALQSDGRIVVAGYAHHEGRTRLTVTRLNSDGSLDSSFNGNGQAILDAGGTLGDYARAVTIAPDGKIVIVGATRRNDQFDLVFARLLSNGALDTSFGTGPIAGTTLVDSGMSDEPAALLRQPDGKWLACGKRRIEGADSDEAEALGMLVVRLDASGAVDPTFGDEGIWRLPRANGLGAARDCALLGDGSVLVAGYLGPAIRRSPALVRLRPDGVVDPVFGVRKISYDGSAELHALLPLPDGKVLLAGGASPSAFEGLEEMFFARVDPETGSADPAFGQLGIASVDFGQSQYAAFATATALLRQPDGGIAVLGSVGLNDDPLNSWDTIASVGLARIAPDGSASQGFVGFALPPFRVQESAGEMIVPVRRFGGPDGAVAVDYETLDGSATFPRDYTAVRGTLTWADGDMEPKFVRVPLTDDAVVEGDESFIVRLTNATTSLAWSEQRLLIDDDDAPPAPAQAGAGNSGAPVAGAGGSPVAAPGSGGGGQLNPGLFLWLLASAVATRNQPGGRAARPRSAT